MNKDFFIGEKPIGNNEPLYLIAEVGTTCLGDIEQAFALIDAGADAGMDAIKFQLIDFEQESDKNAAYKIKTPKHSIEVSRNEMFRKIQFSKEEWLQIRKKCHSRNVEFLSTVDFVAGVHLLEELSIVAHKIGAWDTTFKPLIESIGNTNKPMLVDLGPTTDEELQALINWFKQSGGSEIIFLHDFHTTIDVEMNMAAIQYLLKLDAGPVGYSSPAHDHDLDILAIGLGATVIEKRLIMDRNLDAFHAHESLQPDELKEWVNRIRHVERALGKPKILPSKIDLEGKKQYYRSICTLKDVKKGEEFNEENLHGKRPGTGIPTQELHMFWGKKAAKDLKANQLLQLSDVV